MKIYDPGHEYHLENYAAKEGKPQSVVLANTLHFMKRIGDGYPGNEGIPKDGTNLQELLRVFIDRTKYLDKQQTCAENVQNLADARAQLFRLERRAAYRRGEVYHTAWRERWFALQVKQSTVIEDIPACKICGHILCAKHGEEK